MIKIYLQLIYCDMIWYDMQEFSIGENADESELIQTLDIKLK